MADAPQVVAESIAPAMSQVDSAITAPTPDKKVQTKYEEEKAKRLRPDGSDQFINLSLSDKFRHFQKDPWVNHEALNSQEPALGDGSEIKYLIIGAGYGGLVFAVRLIQAGIKADDIRIVDSAGGFGGTWYWNRYPGLMCDTESYIYMPLLEETGYMPKDKYAYGPELREHAERIASKWNLSDKVLFRVDVNALTWEDDRKAWKVEMIEKREDDDRRNISVYAHCVYSACGLLNTPIIPKLEGINHFKGHVFHTSRWDYKYTGGSPTDQTLEGLKDKRVAIIGTGATAIQAIPHLAKWAKHLYVFQRTPSAVDGRGQQSTTAEQWSNIASHKGWQRERRENFDAFTQNASPRPPVNMVNDQWTRFAAYSALLGGPADGIITPEKAPSHVASLHASDIPRSDRIRARVDRTVKDSGTAEKLKAWYSGWCKRPCFHDDYLPCFNQPNVTLVDTDGQGVDGLFDNGVVANGKEYNVDLLILSTGFRTPLIGSVASKANMTITGRNKVSLDTRWETECVETLHGVVANGFPNFFFPGPAQVGVSANFVTVLEKLAGHVAYIISQARARKGEGFVVEPSREAQKDWSMQVLMRAAAFAGMRGCIPGYLNNYGEADKEVSQEQQMKNAKGAPWGEGLASYVDAIDDWRAEGSMQGIVVTA